MTVTPAAPGPVAGHPELLMKAESLAEDLLDQVWPEGLFPVDPYRIAAYQGADCFRAQIPGDVSGLLIKRAGEAAQIYVDTDDAPVRQRFSAAHEMGHLVAHTFVLAEEGKSLDEAEFDRVEHRGALASQGVDLDEIFANTFAAALLMPAPAVRTLHAVEGVDTSWLARYFDVSKIAMMHRLKNLGLSTK